MQPLGTEAIKQNLILRSLPPDVLMRVSQDLVLRPLALRQVVQPRQRTIDQAIFPVAGVASMVSVADSGASVEVATIGFEGMVGLPLFLGGRSAAVEIFIQVAGEGLYLEAAAFQRHLLQERSLVSSMLTYTQALMNQMAVCAACNTYHTRSQRCARWLLQTQDRCRSETFHLTHEFLGLMLGMRRASVTEAAQELQDRKLIQYNRGVVTVLDRAGLERAACECYRLIASEYDASS